MATRNIFTALTGALTVSLLLTIAGCGGEGAHSTITAQIEANTAVDNHITGSVGDGPIVGARLRVFSKSGKLLLESQSSGTADYDITIKTKGKNYALTVEADQGTDIVTGAPPDFRLVAAITKPNVRSIINLNPFTTLIVSAAQKSGGINDSTIATARDAVVTRYGFGLDQNIIADPTATPIDDSNVHIIVKTSETLGEMVRRTRDALYATGGSLDGDGIMAALAADLSDGWIDGRGARGHDARVAAVANITSAAVLVQAMANRLHVHGVDATNAMDDAIRQVHPTAPADSTTANVAVPVEALEQAIRALAAARALSDNPLIVQTLDVLQNATPGATPADLAPYLPDEVDQVLEELAFTAAYASDDQLAQINTVASSEDDTPPGDEPEPPPPGDEPEPPPEEPPPEEPPPEEPPPDNSPPTISGTPATSVAVGATWEFQPSASDTDGDKLSFSISNKPAWLNFDAATGRAWGSPADKDIGTHSYITISVSDGQDSASLDPFSIVVEAQVVGNATVSWSAPTERTDGSPLTDLAGYKIYYGKNSSSLDNVITIADPNKTSYMVEDLNAGTWYFAVTAYDGEGFESAKSALASKTIS